MQNRRLVVTTSWDDVTDLDIRLCDLLDTYNLKGTFYVIGSHISEKMTKHNLIHISGHHEIGAHTMTHPTLTSIPYEQAKEEIVESKLILERHINREITSFAYPKGLYDQKHIRMVEEAGFSCARTTEPFVFNYVGSPYLIPVSLWAAPHRFRDIRALDRLFRQFPSLAINPFLVKDWSNLGKKCFDLLIQSGGVLHIFGHAWQINNLRGGWEELEDLFQHIAFRKQVSYLSVTEYANIYLRVH